MTVMLCLLTVFLVIGALVSIFMVDRWSAMLGHYFPARNYRSLYEEDFD